MAEQRETWVVFIPSDAESPSCVFQCRGIGEWRETLQALDPDNRAGVERTTYRVGE